MLLEFAKLSILVITVSCLSSLASASQCVFEEMIYCAAETADWAWISFPAWCMRALWHTWWNQTEVSGVAKFPFELAVICSLIGEPGTGGSRKALFNSKIKCLCYKEVCLLFHNFPYSVHSDPCLWKSTSCRRKSANYACVLKPALELVFLP